MDDPQSGPTGQTDDKLLKVIATQGVKSSVGHAALEVLYRRHCEMLWHACTRFVRGRNAADDVLELVDDTFLRVVEHAATYHVNGSMTAEQIAKNTHRWLRKVAFRLYIDRRDAAKTLRTILGTRREDERVSDLACPIKEEDAPQQESVWGDRIRRATAALAKLSERDCNILVISLDWYNREKQEFNVPPDVVEDLCSLYDLSVGTYIQVRYRAFKKVVQDFLGGTACVA